MKLLRKNIKEPKFRNSDKVNYILKFRSKSKYSDIEYISDKNMMVINKHPEMKKQNVERGTKHLKQR